MPKALRRCQPLAFVLFLAAAAPTHADPAGDRVRWRAEAARATITRDDWGIAHVAGAKDADAVFGAIYAQAEDDFPRIEANYLTALGRTAEADGQDAIWADLRQRLFIDDATLQRDYARSPQWLRSLMAAWADGLNFYLATHPAVQPKAIRRFEPWMALAFSEGSIGGDIESVSLSELRAFYGAAPAAPRETAAIAPEPSGSNGIAIAPSDSADGHALLLINPHTSFFFRAELGMRSGEGLHGYGAATWGQFFLYQGWNEHLGFMHTSTGADSIDEFAETIVRRDGRLFYRYGGALRPVVVRTIDVPYRTDAGAIATRRFTVYATHHGPIVRAADGRWVAVALMNRPVSALEQSWLRTKARDYLDYMKVAALQANSSNDTIYADADGTIAYLHPQFVPRRDDRFDYTRPVDGSDPATDWHGLTSLGALPQVKNPPLGWVMNTNDWPWSAAGADSPKAADFPRYMDRNGENPRGLHAAMLLGARRNLTPAGLIAAAYDPFLPAFARLVPLLLAAADRADEPARRDLAGPLAALRGWDDRWAADSVPTSLAVYWAEALLRASGTPAKQGVVMIDRLAATSDVAKLAALRAAVARLVADFGRWQVPWGEINRFQRLDDALHPVFHDDRPSIPVPFTSALWGSLAAFGTQADSGTVKRYGTYGNSFVAVVDFGPRVRAWAVTAGGESGDRGSPHFDDQAARYASGKLRPVYFYEDELAGHIERRYHPGG